METSDRYSRHGLAPAFVAYLDQISATVRESGWAVQFEQVDVDQPYTYAYTVGLMDRGCPSEIAIVGLPVRFAKRVLDEIALSMVSGEPTPPPTLWPCREDRPDLMFQARMFMPRPSHPITFDVIRDFYGQQWVPVAQYVWPDDNGCYPWDAGWAWGGVQPVLWAEGSDSVG